MRATSSCATTSLMYCQRPPTRCTYVTAMPPYATFLPVGGPKELGPVLVPVSTAHRRTHKPSYGGRAAHATDFLAAQLYASSLTVELSLLTPSPRGSCIQDRDARGALCAAPYGANGSTYTQMIY